MKWFNIEIEDQFVIDEFAQYLRQNKVKYEASDLDGHGKHFEIYCDEKMANELDNALDRIYDHIADNNQKII